MHQYWGHGQECYNTHGEISSSSSRHTTQQLDQETSPVTPLPLLKRRLPVSVEITSPPQSPSLEYQCEVYDVNDDSNPERPRKRSCTPVNSFNYQSTEYCTPPPAPSSGPTRTEYLSPTTLTAPAPASTNWASGLCSLSRSWSASPSPSPCPFGLVGSPYSRSVSSTPGIEGSFHSPAATDGMIAASFSSYGHRSISHSTASPADTLSIPQQAPIIIKYPESSNNTHVNSRNFNGATSKSQTAVNIKHKIPTSKCYNDFILLDSNEPEPCLEQVLANTLGHKWIQIDHKTVCIGGITSGAIVCNLQELSSRDQDQGVFLAIFTSTESPIDTDERLPFFLTPEFCPPVVGYLDEPSSKIIKPLLHRQLVQIQALLDPNPAPAKDQHENRYTVYLNIYVSDTGVRVKGLGDFFVKNRVWLQHPVSPVPDIPYRNPHFLCRPGTILTTSKFSSITQPKAHIDNHETEYRSTAEGSYTLTLAQEAKGNLEGLFDSLSQKTQGFGHIEQDFRIITPLLPHQKDAVYFMLQRETHRVFDKIHGESSCSLWKRVPAIDGQYTYQNIITGKIQLTIPSQSLGGLLADHMGLGKTLSMLSLIIHTLPGRFQNPQPHQPLTTNEEFSKTTLVITTKSVLSQWEQQVQQHVRHGTLKVLSYFGNQRNTPSEQFFSQDVVFTTYDIVSHEWRKSLQQTGSDISTLHAISWYRIVLDEAHNIRNRNTDRAKAIKQLHAERRWCVTGTPIQNSMDDIAGLLLFLRLEPFDDYDTFRDYIRMPLERGDSIGMKRLRTLVDSFTLRRVKETVKLPQRTMYTNCVELGLHERQLYDEYLQQSKYFLDKAINTPGTRHAKTALEIILSLRLICDHGQDLLSSGDTCRDLLEEDIQAETQRGMDADEFSNPIFLYQELCCQSSQAAPSSLSTDPEGDIAMLDAGTTMVSKPGGHDIKSSASRSKPQPKFPNYSGPSSKVRALLSILQQPKNEWKHSSSPIKSVVFSVWTRMLDLIGIALTNQNIKFCRLDGSMSGISRDTCIRQFNNDPETTVILVSIMAGGVGLNLTTASQVHLMEPHWNPMVEEQALDRVHRIGQQNDVQIFRYLVKDSFEISMMELQKKKQAIARLAMEKLTKEDLRVQKLKEIRALFN